MFWGWNTVTFSTLIKRLFFYKHHSIRIKHFLVSIKKQLRFNIKFRSCFNVDKLTLFQRWNRVIFSTLIWRFQFFKHHDIRRRLLLESTQNQRCFNLKFWHWFDVDKFTLFRRWNTVTFSTLIFSSIMIIRVISAMNLVDGLTLTNRRWINVDITLTDVALFQHISTLNQRWVFAGCYIWSTFAYKCI